MSLKITRGYEETGKERLVRFYVLRHCVHVVNVIIWTVSVVIQQIVL